jgi:pyrimidine deaminase RibD-like protein
MKQNDHKWLSMSLELAKKCPPTQTAFSVGAVIIDSKGELISTGYSRETDPKKHAEEIAIEKALKAKRNLTNSTIYSSLEPCGERLSGKKTCVQWIIETGINRVVFAEYEPPAFVKGIGEELLKKANITVDFISL